MLQIISRNIVASLSKNKCSNKKKHESIHKRIAYHKAGHALLNVYFNEEETYNNIQSISLSQKSIRDDYNNNTITSYSDIVKGLGGIAAENIVYNNDCVLTGGAIKDYYIMKKQAYENGIIIDDAYKLAIDCIVNNRERLDHLVTIMLEKDVVNGSEIVNVCLFFF